MPPTAPATVQFEVDGEQVAVPDDGATLLEVLRDRLGRHSPKDGCSPQGQCGCCTVLVDGAARVACVTPVRRIAGRQVTTLEGMDPATIERWADALCAVGGSQCGFCTPGIVVRLAATDAKAGGSATPEAVERALQAHLCRCTGWQTIVEAWTEVQQPRRRAGAPDRDLEAAGRRATIEGRALQQVGPHIALGGGGFAEDTAPADALVAVPDGADGWVVADTLAEARRRAGKVQGRRTTKSSEPPLALPEGDWAASLRTSWVEPGYLEPDASWCIPGGEPATMLANGGAFGAKHHDRLKAAARTLADEHGRAVRVLWSREDAVRHGAKRPPVAGGMNADGTGILRVARTPGIADAIALVAPGLRVEEVDVVGPPTSAAIRAAGWAEAMVLTAGATRSTGPIRSPDGGEAEAVLDGTTIRVRVAAGDPLDDVTLRSYAIGAAHMAYGWVTGEALAVDESGSVQDLTIRSFGIPRAVDTPPIEVEIDRAAGPPVNGSDAVFVAVAAALWLDRGCPTSWPTG